jgi:hypothetical protein
MTARLARAKAWAIRAWRRVPSAKRKSAVRALRILGEGLNALVISGEVLIILPFALLALTIADAAGGPAYVLLLMATVWVVVGRQSVRATLWFLGGVYVAIKLLELSSGIADVSSAPDVWRVTIARLMTALALAVTGGVVALPIVYVARTRAPRVSATVGGWLSSTIKGALAGAAAGSLVENLLPPTGGWPDDPSGARLWLPTISTALGILCAWCGRIWQQGRRVSGGTVRSREL